MKIRWSVIHLIGCALALSKKDILNSFKLLSTLKIKKVFICSLPFSTTYTFDKNNSIHQLNTLLYNLTCRHSEKFVFIDTKKFIKNKLSVTGKTFYLPRRLKFGLAKPFYLKLLKRLDSLRSSCYKVRVKSPLEQSSVSLPIRQVSDYCKRWNLWY